MNDSCARITLDVQNVSTSVFVPLKRGDTGRKIIINLVDGGFPYEIAGDCYAVLSGTKPDGNILFNHCSIEGNTIVYEVTEQTTAAAGRILCAVQLYGSDDALITSAIFRIIVDGTIYVNNQVESSSEYSALTQLISEATSLVDDVESKLENGEFVGPQGEQGPQGEAGEDGVDGESAYEIAVRNGFRGTEKEWLESLQGKSAYDYAVEGGFEGTETEFMELLANSDADPSADPELPIWDQLQQQINDLKENGTGSGSTDSSESASIYIGPEAPTNGTLYWLDTSEDEEIVEPEVTLTGISAAYSGGEVAVGTDVSALAGIVVTAEYSDGSTAEVTDYTLSGEIIEGSNTITVEYEGMTATFAVTGVAESSGEEEEPEAVTYTVTNTLTNVTSDNAAASVEENTAYTATLTAADGYELDTVTVTMGGTDVTADVYADGVVNIVAVTGDVVITVSAVEKASSLEYIDISQYLKLEGQQINTIYNGVTIRWAESANSNTYSVPVTAGTYRLSAVVSGQYAVPGIQNVNFKTISTSKLPVSAEDPDFSTISITFTTAESCSYTEEGKQDDETYLWTLDVVFPSDGYFLFSISPSNHKSFAKVVA